MSTPRQAHRRLLVAAMAAITAATAIAVGGGAAVAQPLPPPQEVLSHFLCYTGTFAPFERVHDVRLADQFPPGEIVTVGKPKLLCNPVRKTRSDRVTKIVDRRQHLKAYVTVPNSAGVADIDVLVSNQFGRDKRLRVEDKVFRLMVPTRKSPHDAPVLLDHFACYPVLRGAAVDRAVRLKDQFTEIGTRVGKPRLLCNPTVKVHALNPPTIIEHPQAHLVCYAIDERRLVPPVARFTKNQFEGARARAEVAVMLCVPSRKRLVVP
jgi:hypothetical protein